MLERMWRKGNPPALMGGIQVDAATVEVPQNTKNRITIWSSKIVIKKDKCIPMFVAALFTIAKTWKQPKCPSTDEWVNKMWYIHKMEYYSAKKMPFAATWMNLDIIIPSEVRKRKANNIRYHFYVESKIGHKWTYLWNRIRDTENRQGVAKGDKGGTGLDWESGVSWCKLEYTEWINKRSYWMTHGTIFNILWKTIMEKNMKNNVYIDICTAESLCCSAVITTIL